MRDSTFTTEGPYKYPQLWDGCVGAWFPGLGPTSTVLYDWSGFGQNGTFNVLTPANWITVNGLPVISQDGTASQRITIKNGPALALQNGDYSISVWASLTAAQSYTGICFFNGCGIFTEIGGLSFAMMNASACTRKVAATAGSLTHVVATRTGTTYGLFTNGVDSSSSNVESGFGLNSVYALGQGYATNYLNGYYDDVRVYNRVLSIDEIKLLHSSGNGRGIAYAPADNLEFR